MLESGRLESTQLVGLDQTPIVLKDSLLLRVPTDRLRRRFRAPTRTGGSGLPLRPLPLGEGWGEGAFVAPRKAPSPGLQPASPRGRGEILEGGGERPARRYGVTPSRRLCARQAGRLPHGVVTSSCPRSRRRRRWRPARGRGVRGPGRGRRPRCSGRIRLRRRALPRG